MFKDLFQQQSLSAIGTRTDELQKVIHKVFIVTVYDFDTLRSVFCITSTVEVDCASDFSLTGSGMSSIEPTCVVSAAKFVRFNW